ncbi:MAG TPA: ABC transporter permease [Vicinamibacterales bacterium]|jgi:predicted permease|nr:ABC transporter permease [Vicinamibacterales bacterium]
MTTLLQDVKYALRTLTKSPGYAAVTILTLALGIGANTAIFSVVNGVLLKPLPYPQPDRLELITSQFPSLGFDKFWISPPEYLEFKQRNRSFQDVGGYRSGSVNLGTPERPQRVNSAVVTPELLGVLGVQPLRGRLFTEADSAPGAEPVAVVSYNTWRNEFSGDESLIGRSVKIDGAPTRIVGIMPRGYDVHDERIAVYLPLTIDPKTFPTRRGNHFLYLIGRLKNGVTPAQAASDIEGMLTQWRSLSGGHSPDPKTHRIQMEPLKAEVIGGIATALWVLQGAVGFVLLIACANLANLILARAETRQKEFAIRSALGAGRFRLLRQFLTEGVLLALVGGVIGAGLGFAGLRLMLSANPDSIPRVSEITLDPRVLIFTILISVVTGIIFGMAPLLHLRQQVVSMSLKESGQRSTAGTARTRVRSGLVMAEVALAVVLVVGAGLLLRSFEKLMQVDAGFNRTNLMTFGLVLPPASYPKAQDRVDFLERIVDQIKQLPGVTAAASMSGLPPTRDVNANDTNIDGYMSPSDPKDGPAENVDYYQTASLDYIKTMGIPIVEGRDFQLSDVNGGGVVLINETMAKTFFGFRKIDPIGQRLKPGFSATLPWLTIVGVVRDVKQGGVNKKAGTEVYFLNEQGPRLTGFSPQNMNIVVRSSAPFDQLAAEIRRIVQSADPSLPIVKMRPMEQVFEDAAARPKFLAELLGIFAALALALAAIGTYGILSYSVTERTREIGIHMALGATKGSVLGMILGQGMRLTIVGLVGGLIASFGLTRLLQAQLFNIKPTDPITLTAVAVFIAVVAFLACYLPARRATSVDPMVTLRDA